jgi:hypothetical protein
MIETECFRIAQEALSNVVKHAQARAVTVELTRNDEQLHLSVRDDGVGFDVVSVREQAVRGASLGVLSMEERARLAGGGLHYHSTPGQGAEVHAWFPLKWVHPSVSGLLSWRPETALARHDDDTTVSPHPGPLPRREGEGLPVAAQIGASGAPPSQQF